MNFELFFILEFERLTSPQLEKRRVSNRSRSRKAWTDVIYLVQVAGFRKTYRENPSKGFDSACVGLNLCVDGAIIT